VLSSDDTLTNTYALSGKNYFAWQQREIPEGLTARTGSQGFAFTLNSADDAKKLEVGEGGKAGQAWCCNFKASALHCKLAYASISTPDAYLQCMKITLKLESLPAIMSVLPMDCAVKALQKGLWLARS